MRIIFLGTPDFAVPSLEALHASRHEVVAVVTSADKPAGRGQKITESAVKIAAKRLGIPILQPTNLKDETFLTELRSYHADLQVVVAFRMLPEVVWNMPPHGTINLHAALLPQYRGAAPINWAVINGDKETGVSTFLLKQEIDTGDVILREKVDILPEDNAGTVHDKLMNLGGDILLRTIDLIENNEVKFLKQSELSEGVELRPAPKIFKEDMKINWMDEAEKIHNFVRGLSPYPCAWTEFPVADGSWLSCKIFRTSKTENKVAMGKIECDGKRILIGTATTALQVEELQLSGKKRMATRDFLSGFHFSEGDVFCK